MLDGLARFVHAHARILLGIALICAAVSGLLGAGVASRLDPYDAKDPATQSVQATHRFQAAAGRQIDAGVVALINSGPVNTAAARARVNGVAAQLRREPHVASVLTHYETHAPGLVSRDGRSTYVLVYFKPLPDKTLQDEATRIEAAFAGRRDVALGGYDVANAQVNAEVGHDLARATLLALPVIFLLSLLFFRSLVAALLPPLLGGIAIVCTFLALRIVSGFVGVSVYALDLTTGLGLGLAIDYSLFTVSRYREEAAVHGFGYEAMRRTLNTSGRTILFSSITVAVAIASLLVFPQNFLYSMGIAGVIVAVLAATLALVALPALLIVLGPRVNALAPAWLARAAAKEARPASSGPWYRLSRFVMRRPAAIAVLCACLLIGLGLPFTGIRLISATTAVLPPGVSSRVVDDRIATRFPGNLNSTVDVVVGLPTGSPQLQQLRKRIAGLADVSAVAPAQSAGPRLSLIDVSPDQASLTHANQKLVQRIRAWHPAYYLGVAGQEASFVDLEHSLVAHLPVALIIVVVAVLVVLFLMTGSVVLPIKAILMNALSLSAMFGILVLIFQDGNLQGLLGFTSEGALDATQPIFLFAVGFGLATDYGVFLLSRIKEAYDSGLSNSEAVAVGLERTGRIVTAAALLFAVAIGSFVTSHIVFIQELGLGAAVTVLIDASVIRALLVPSLMELLGTVNWWAPAPLRRLHRHIGLSESGSARTIKSISAS
jgi:RND superfamily putative drug exporter